MSSLTLQFPDELLADAKALAQQEHVSVEEYVIRVLAKQVKGSADWQRLVERGKQVTREQFLEILRKASDVPPQPGDELP